MGYNHSYPTCNPTKKLPMNLQVNGTPVEQLRMSGKSAKLWVDLETYVEDLRPRVCKIWGSGVGLQILSQALGFIGFRGLGV